MSKIAIIGASYLQLPAVKKAKEMGHEVICFAWPEGAICKNHADRFYPISITDKDRILEICKQEKIDGITTVASDLAVWTVNYVASNMGLVSNPYEWTDITTNKYKMRECFMSHGVPSPSYRLINQLEESLRLNVKFPVIVKPTDRSGSRGIYKVVNQTQLSSAIEAAMSEGFSSQVLVEDFIDGHEVSVESISFRGNHHIIQITDKVTTGAPHFVELEHHQPSSLPTEIKARIKEITLRALDALHIEYGASHTELKISDDGDIKVIEVGARGGGDFIASNLVELSTGYDFMKAIINVSLGIFETPEILDKKYSGVYFLSKETSWLLEILENASKYPEIEQWEISSHSLNSITCSADRNGYMIYTANQKLNLHHD